MTEQLQQTIPPVATTATPSATKSLQRPEIGGTLETLATLETLSKAGPEPLSVRLARMVELLESGKCVCGRSEADCVMNCKK